MANLLVQSRDIADLVRSATHVSEIDETYRVIDRLLPSVASESISISLLLLSIHPLAKMSQMYDGQTVHKLVGGLLAILLEQTPDVVYIDCAEKNEFIVLLPAVEPDQALTAGEEIGRRFEGMAKSVLNRKRLKAHLKGGLAVFPQDADNRIDLFRLCREAVLRASQKKGTMIIQASKEEMVHHSTQYSNDQLERLKNISSREGISEDILLREALDHIIKRYMDI